MQLGGPASQKGFAWEPGITTELTAWFTKATQNFGLRGWCDSFKGKQMCQNNSLVSKGEVSSDGSWTLGLKPTWQN